MDRSPHLDVYLHNRGPVNRHNPTLWLSFEARHPGCQPEWPYRITLILHVSGVTQIPDFTAKAPTFDKTITEQVVVP